MRLFTSLEKGGDKHVAQLWPQRMNEELFPLQLKASATQVFSVFLSFSLSLENEASKITKSRKLFPASKTKALLQAPRHNF